MNRAYRVIYSKARQAFMVVNEVANASHKKARSTKALVTAVACTLMAMGAQVANADEQKDYDHTYTNQSVTITNTDNTNKLLNAIFNGGTVTINEDVAIQNEGYNNSTFIQAHPTTGSITFNGTTLNNKGGTLYGNWLTFKDTTATIVGKEVTSSMGGYGKVTIDTSKIDLGKNGLIWAGKAADGTGLYRNFDVVNSTITMHGDVDTPQQTDTTTPSYKPKSSSRAVLFGSFYKNNTNPDLSITDPSKLGNKLVLTNSVIDVTGAAGLNFLYGEVDRTSSINVASGGDLIISSYSGDGQGTSKMTGSTFTVKGTLNNKGKLANEVDNLIIDGGVFDNTSGSFVSNVITVDGEVTNAMVTVQNGGKIITKANLGSSGSGWVFNPKGGLTLASGGQLVLTTLNSNEDASLNQGTGTNVKDQFLVQFPLILDGGTFVMQDGSAVTKMKIGSQKSIEAGAKPTLTVKSGDYSLDNLNFSNDSGCTVAINGGSLTLKKLNMSATAGSVTITGGKLTVTDSAQGNNSNQNLILAGGTFATNSKVIMSSGASASGSSSDRLWQFDTSGNSFWTTNTKKTSGYVDLIDITGYYTLGDLKAAQTALDSGAKVQVTFSKGTLKVNGDLTSSAVDGVAVVGHEVQVSGSSASFSGANTTVGSLNFSSGSGTATIDTSSGNLTLSGESGNGNVFGGNMKSVTVSGNLTLGIAGAAGQTKVNTDTLSAQTLTVNGTVSGNTIKITGSGSTITSGASLSATSIDGGSSGLAVSGTLSANTVAGTVNVQSGGNVYLSSGLTGASITGTLQTGTAATTQVQSRMARDVLASTDTMQAGDGINSLVSTNRYAQSILAQSTLSNAFNGRDVLYVDNLIKVDSTAQLNIGVSTVQPLDAATNAITIGRTGVLVVDASKLSSTAPIIDGNVYASASGAQVRLLNATGLGTYALANSVTLNNGESTIETDNLFVKGTLNSTSSGASVTLAFNDSAVSNKALQSQMSSAMNDRRNGAVLLAVGQSDTYVDTQTQQLNALGEKAVSQYLATPVVAGTYNAALDAASTLSNALYLHSAEAGKNAALWANVLASSNSADTLFGDSGYESDVFGGVLGLEGTMPCGAHFGLAISAGSSDANSVNAVNAFTSTGDFLGVSAYASHALVNNTVLVSADFSYLWLQNDIAGYVAGASVAEKVNSSVKTLGVRGDWLAYQGLVDVTPHVAIRYVGVDMDSYRSIESENANLFQIPVGVKLSKTFTSPSGVQLMPTFDFTATPKFGDTKINTALGDTRIDNSQFNTAIGLSGTFDAYTFNLSYQYGFGAGERADNVFNASIRYTF